MKTSYTTISALELCNLIRNRKLNTDPVGQRPAVSSTHDKSIAIIESLIRNGSFGCIILRDISKDEEMQIVYPGVQYLVVDGGHRGRAIRNFYDGKFSVNGKYFNQYKIDPLADIMIQLDIKVCTTREAIRLFKDINKTTGVNFIESIMCDDESDVCKFVRSQTKSYKEYGNEVHDLFETKVNRDGDLVPRLWDGQINPRRKWDEYIMVSILKIEGGGNVDAGQKQIDSLIARENSGNFILSDSLKKNVDRFLTDIYRIQKLRSKKMTNDTFSTLQCVWFELFNQNNKFKIQDFELFVDAFDDANVKLTGKKNKVYNRELIVHNGEEMDIKSFIRKNSKNYANSTVQKICAKRLLEEMHKINDGDIGVVFPPSRDKKRTLSEEERYELWVLQNKKCSIDGQPLDYDEAVFAHDIAWSNGGKTSSENGSMIRKTHNTAMGTLTINEYKKAKNF